MIEPPVPASLAPGLANAIRAASVVSFDVFDTALVRATEKPVDAFVLLAQEAGITDTLAFARDRIAAEASARRQAWEERRATEVQLPEIYARMSGAGLPPVEQLLEAERALELRLCRRHPQVGAAYDWAVALGKRVGFVSDIYLDRDLVAAMLEYCGYPSWDFLLVSSELGVTKSTGELFQRLLKHTQVAAQDHLHIGDNLESDGRQARRAGFVTWSVVKCSQGLDQSPVGKRLRRAGVSPIHLDSASMASPRVADASWHSLWRGLIAAHLSRPERDFWYTLGYTHVGMLLLGFALWVGRRADDLGISQLYFLARDGYIMHRLHEALRTRGVVSCSSRYLHASRRSLNLPALIRIDEGACDFLVSGTTRMRVGDFLARIGMDPASFAEPIIAAGLSGPEQVVATGTDYGRLRALFRSLEPTLLAQAESERRLIRDYFEQEQVLDQRHIGLVDIGWHGSLQDSFQRLLGLYGCEHPVSGLYLGTFPPAKPRVAAGARHYTYLCQGGEPEYRFLIIRLSVEIFEWLFCAPHGSVLGFQRDEQSRSVVPILESGELERPRHATASRMQAGALQFIEDVLHCFPVNSPIPPISADLAISLLAELLARPTSREADLLGELPHAEGFGTVMSVRPIARPPARPYNVLAWRQLFRDYRQSFWRPGYLRRLYPDRW